MVTTLKDIGDALGLSQATVSRALNGFPEVGEATRRRVVATADRLHYRPNPNARRLVGGKSGMVGLVIDRPAPGSTDPTFLHVIAGIAAALARDKVDLMLQVAVEDDPLAPYRRLVASDAFDGFIINGPRQNDPRIAFLTAAGAKFVVHGREDAAAPYPYYDLDNRAVSTVAVEMLADLGHRRIALINGPADYAFARDRRLGFDAALTEHGLVVPPDFVLDGPLDETFGYMSALRLLRGESADRPTAILCSSTLVAHGVYRAAADRGLDIPRDLSVVAHDDDVPDMLPGNFVPRLTVTRSPLAAACEPLAEILLGVIRPEEARGPLQRLARPDFVLGRSASAPLDTSI